MDPKTQKERWRVINAGGMAGGGTLATAGNVVFHGPVAYNAENGEKLWELDLGGVNVTPITYMLDGKQYVTMFARGYPDNRLFTLVLDGKESIPSTKSASAPESSQPHQ
jgi:glucose dehydrogenase